MKKALFAATLPFRYLARPILETYEGVFGRSVVLALYLAVLAQGLVNIVSYCVVVASRIIEPGPIQWLEPLFLRSALQAFHGAPLYGAPSLDYTGSMYTPGYDILNGLAMHLFHVGYAPLRVIAFGAFIAIVVVIGTWVFLETRDLLWTMIISVCLFSIDPSMNYWFSSVNVDTGYLFLMFAGMYMVYSHARSKWAVYLAAALVAASFMFKQQGLPVALALFVYLFFTDIRQGLRFGIACAALAGGLCLYYLVTSHGWFWTSVVLIPSAVPAKGSFWYFHSLMKISPFATIMFFTLLPWFVLRSASGRVRAPRLFWFLLSLAFTCLSWLGFRKVGGGANSLAPILIFAFLLFGLTRGSLAKEIQQPGVRLAVHVSLLIMALLVVRFGFGNVRQMARLLHPPNSFVRPWNAVHPENTRFERLVAKVVKTNTGPVFVGARFMALEKEGKPLNTHQTPLYNGTRRSHYYDIDAIAGPPLGAARYSAVVLWEFRDSAILPFLKKRYKKEKDLGPDPLIGIRVGVWRPIKSQTRFNIQGADPRVRPGQTHGFAPTTQ